VRSTTFSPRRQTSPLARRRGCDGAGRSGWRSGGADYGAGQASVAAEPPGARRKGRVATREVVSPCAAVLVEESLVALEGLDARPLVAACDPRGQPSPGLARVGPVTPVRAEHGFATDELNALLAALFGGPGHRLVDLLADELRVLGVAQVLEAGSTTKAELNDVKQLGVVVVESVSTPVLMGCSTGTDATYGQQCYGQYPGFQGMFDEVGVWDRVLSLDEIHALYRKPLLDEDGSHASLRASQTLVAAVPPRPGPGNAASKGASRPEYPPSNGPCTWRVGVIHLRHAVDFDNKADPRTFCHAFAPTRTVLPGGLLMKRLVPTVPATFCLLALGLTMVACGGSTGKTGGPGGSGGSITSTAAGGSVASSVPDSGGGTGGARFDAGAVQDRCRICTTSADCSSGFCNLVASSDLAVMIKQPTPVRGLCSPPGDQGTCSCTTGFVANGQVCIGTGCPVGTPVTLCENLSGTPFANQPIGTGGQGGSISPGDAGTAGSSGGCRNSGDPSGPACGIGEICHNGACAKCPSVWYVSYQTPVQKNPIALAMGDANDDGIPDAFVINYLNASNVSVLLGAAGGKFHESAILEFSGSTSPYAVTAADFNGDLKLDLAVITTNIAPSVTIWTGAGDGSFRKTADYKMSSSPNAVTSADLNRDGQLDLIVGTYSSGMQIFMGKGDGTFASPWSIASGGNIKQVMVADINGDDSLDLLASCAQTNEVQAFLGNGDGTFGAPLKATVGKSPSGMDIQDLNGDGKVDVVAANRDGNSVSILLGNGDGTFTAAGDLTGQQDANSVKVVDLNGDGIRDLAVAVAYALRIFLGKGDGTFTPMWDFDGSKYVYSLQTVDLNGDSVPDILAAFPDLNTLAVYMSSPCSSGP
jgi:hypothetical protein